MVLYRRKDSRLWQYDFTVRGERFRGSTGETKRASAAEAAARLLSEVAEGKRQTTRKPQTLSDFSARFLLFVENAKLEPKSKEYLRNGWRLLALTGIGDIRMDMIGTEQVDALQIPCGPYNVNCALKTMRRMLNLARTWGLIAKVPKIRLQKEIGRSLRLDEDAETRLLPFSSPLLKDVIILVRDTGMRVKKEVFRMRIENMDWNNRVIFVPDSKTASGRRCVPMSDRVLDLLLVRSAGRREGWVFTADSASGHMVTIDKQFRKARQNAKLSKDLKLYCGRHDFGTEMLRKTGNLALVMKVMGQTSTKAAMQYQHPELEDIRTAINASRPEVREKWTN